MRLVYNRSGLKWKYFSCNDFLKCARCMDKSSNRRISVYSNICKWILRRLLLVWLLSRVELSHVHLVLLREPERILLLLLGHHACWVRHEWVWLVLLLHVGKWILAHILLLLHHHVRLELLLHVGRHHLHHLVLLRHVHLRLLLLVAHRVGDKANWLVCICCLRLLLLLWHLHAEWIPSRCAKVYLLLLHGLVSVHVVSRGRIKIENIDVLSSL